MCGRFILELHAGDLSSWLGASVDDPWEPHWNLAPAQDIPVARLHPLDGSLHVHLARWGLVPHNGKGPDIGPLLFNARRETVDVRPAFAPAYRRRRAAVPASAFAEWSKGPAGKVPWRIQRADGGPMLLAALWERWLRADGTSLLSTTILTQPAVGVVGSIHDRMPVIFSLPEALAWMAAGAAPERVSELRTAAPPPLVAAQLSGRFSSTENRDAAVALPVGPYVDRL